jgi:uncharacterized membrane-anchored protein YjiN (DUF445 family)
VRVILAGRTWAPAVATVIEIARQRDWDEHLVAAAFRALSDSLERPAMRAMVTGLVDDLLQHYRQEMGGYPRFWIGMADLLGLIDRRRIVASLRSGVREVAEDPSHPLRQTLRAGLTALPGRLRAEPALAARVDAVARELLEGETLRGLLKDLSAMLQRSVFADVDGQRSELIAWVAERLEQARLDVIADEVLRRDLDLWVKRRLIEAIERHHGRIAEVIREGRARPRPRWRRPPHRGARRRRSAVHPGQRHGGGWSGRWRSTGSICCCGGSDKAAPGRGTGPRP